jgi:predicted small secreted protein
MSKWTRMLALTIGASMLLGYGLACNTAEGMGKDTQRAGEKLENAADRNK